MYSVSIIGLDREGNEHHVGIPVFKYADTISCVINHAIDDITDSPWFCIVDSVTIENTETSLIQTFELYTSNKEKAKIEVYSLVKGWITRDAIIIPDKKTLFADVEKSFDSRQAGFKLLLEYFMMAPEEQAKRHKDYAQLIASLISGHME